MDNFDLWYRINRAKFASGSPPLTFQGTGQPTKNWTIYGHTSANLFDVSAVSDDSGIDRDTGEIVESSGSSVSDWIAYDSSQELFLSASRTIAAATSVIFAFFDSAKNYIDWVGVAFSVGAHSYEVTEIPDSAAFFRVQFFDDGFSNVMINQGETALPYEPFGGVGVRTENLFDLSKVDTSLLYDNDKIKLIGGYWQDILSGTTGQTTAMEKNNSFFLTEGKYWLDFKRSNVFGSGIKIVKRDENFSNQTTQPTSGDGYKVYPLPFTLDAPSYVSFRRGSGIVIFSDLMLYKGETAPTKYEPYGYKIPITCGGETTNIYIGDMPLGTGQTVTGSESGVAIPTVDGENTLSFGTTVQPSKVVISAASGMTESVKRYFDYKYGVLKMAGIKE